MVHPKNFVLLKVVPTLPGKMVYVVNMERIDHVVKLRTVIIILKAKEFASNMVRREKNAKSGIVLRPQLVVVLVQSTLAFDLFFRAL
jgi:hypothetical protein